MALKDSVKAWIELQDSNAATSKQLEEARKAVLKDLEKGK